MSNTHEHAWCPLQIKCGLTADSGKKDADGKPILSHRYGFHMLCHAAASLFIQYLGWTPKHLQTCRAICSRTSKPITPTWRSWRPPCGPLDALRQGCDNANQNNERGRSYSSRRSGRGVAQPG